jgi:glycosyltransferase involved in cell wall biosynthesis
MNNKLAIIIPAFKPNFLAKTLDSLALQTNKNFNVYIGDDGSPFNLFEIIKPFFDRLNLYYHRFENNLGAENIVIHWNRCLSLLNEEKWVLVFSDDDTLDTNCVEKFYYTIEEDKERHEVYRFDTRVINDEGELIIETNESPILDNSFNMTIDILLGKRGNSMPDHIFLVNKVKLNKGFVYTKYGQAADWASSIFFSYSNGIKTMKGAKVNWRLGVFNISGSASKHRNQMLEGHLEFITWVFDFISTQYSKEEVNELVVAIKYNLTWVIRNHYKGVTLKGILMIYNCLSKIWLERINLFRYLYGFKNIIKIK